MKFQELIDSESKAFENETLWSRYLGYLDRDVQAMESLENHRSDFVETLLLESVQKYGTTVVEAYKTFVKDLNK